VAGRAKGGVIVAELTALVDVPATVVKVQTLADNGLRLTLDLPEGAIEQAALLMGLRERYLQVVIYDADEFNAALIASEKQ